MDAQNAIATIWSNAEITSRAPSLDLHPQYTSPIGNAPEAQASQTGVLDSQTVAGTIGNANTHTANDGTVIPSKFKKWKYDILLASGSILLSTFAFYYVYQSLVVSQPALGHLLFSPSTTVFVINIISQILAIVINLLFASAFEALRWQLASREIGVHLATFLGMSGATSPAGVLTLLMVKGTHQFWCLQKYSPIVNKLTVRLFYPLLCLFVSIILTGISYLLFSTHTASS
jgi:hypothetical protein